MPFEPLTKQELITQLQTLDPYFKLTVDTPEASVARKCLKTSIQRMSEALANSDQPERFYHAIQNLRLLAQKIWLDPNLRDLKFVLASREIQKSTDYDRGISFGMALYDTVMQCIRFLSQNELDELDELEVTPSLCPQALKSDGTPLSDGYRYDPALLYRELNSGSLYFKNKQSDSDFISLHSHRLPRELILSIRDIFNILSARTESIKEPYVALSFRSSIQKFVRIAPDESSTCHTLLYSRLPLYQRLSNLGLSIDDIVVFDSKLKNYDSNQTLSSELLELCEEVSNIQKPVPILLKDLYQRVETIEDPQPRTEEYTTCPFIDRLTQVTYVFNAEEPLFIAQEIADYLQDASEQEVERFTRNVTFLSPKRKSSLFNKLFPAPTQNKEVLANEFLNWLTQNDLLIYLFCDQSRFTKQSSDLFINDEKKLEIVESNIKSLALNSRKDSMDVLFDLMLTDQDFGKALSIRVLEAEEFPLVLNQPAITALYAQSTPTLECLLRKSITSVEKNTIIKLKKLYRDFEPLFLTHAKLFAELFGKLSSAFKTQLFATIRALYPTNELQEVYQTASRIYKVVHANNWGAYMELRDFTPTKDSTKRQAFEQKLQSLVESPHEENRILPRRQW